MNKDPNWIWNKTYTELIPLGMGIVLLILGCLFCTIFTSEARSPVNPQFRVEIATELIQAIRDNDRNAISKRIQIDSKEWEKLVNTREKFTGDFKIETQTKLLWPLEDNDLIISFKSGTILQCKFHDQDIAETGSIKIYACKIEDKK